MIVFIISGCALIGSPVIPDETAETKRELVAAARWLHFPVKTGASKRAVTITSKGLADYHFELELADADVDWWAPLDLSRNDGLVYVPMPVIPGASDRSFRVFARGGTVRFSTLDLYVLRSAWFR